MPSHRILYVGADLALLESLKVALKDCHIVRATDVVARSLIASDIGYSLLIMDGGLQELASFARTLQHRERTPILILTAGDAKELIEEIRRLLNG